MAWREEKAAVEGALVALLPTLSHPHLAVPLGFRLSQLTGLPEKRCRTVLGWLAKEGHPHATHDGGTVLSYGRSVQRWRWHPQPQKTLSLALPSATLEARLNAGGMLDTSDW